MKLTEIESVEKSIEQWEWLAETGKDKAEWPGWVWNGGQYDADVRAGCFLCEYAKGQPEGGRVCPYYKKYGFCEEAYSPYWRWVHTATIRIKKEYARQFLEQLKEILKSLEGR